MTRVKECVLYRGFEHGEILDKMTALMDACEKSAVNAKEMEEDFYECVNGLNRLIFRLRPIKNSMQR